MSRSIRTRGAASVAIVTVLAGAALLFAQRTDANPSTAATWQLDSEIAAVQRDVDGAKDNPSARADAQAKLKILLDERTERDAALRQRPATKAEEDAKKAQADAFSKEVEGTNESHHQALRKTETGELRDNSPITNEKGLLGNITWVGQPESDGYRLVIWGLGLRADSTKGVVIIGRASDITDDYRSITRLEVPGHGQLTVIDEKGGAVIMRGADGTELLFDTKTLAFR